MYTKYIAGVSMKERPSNESYLFDLPVVKYLVEKGRLNFTEPVTFFVGENGTGKSTLLEAIAIAMGFNAEGGSRDFLFSTKDSHSELYKFLTIIRTGFPDDGFFLRAESFYNTASYLDLSSDLRRYGGISFHEQSHGEAFLSLVSHRFGDNGLYLLDEPEAALSPQKLLSLVCAIDGLVKRGSQFIIATHSPILMVYPKASIMQFSEEGIRESISYRDTEHYKVTKQVLDEPERMMKYLLD